MLNIYTYMPLAIYLISFIFLITLIFYLITKKYKKICIFFSSILCTFFIIQMILAIMLGKSFVTELFFVIFWILIVFLLIVEKLEISVDICLSSEEDDDHETIDTDYKENQEIDK